MTMLARNIALAAALLMFNTLNLQPVWAQNSEFIENPPQLTPDATRPGAMIWVKPGFEPSRYKAVLLEPVTIFISPDSKYKGIDASELLTLASGFRESMINTLEPEIPVVNKPGPGVLLVRSALTDVKLEKKKRGLLGYTPIGIVVVAAQNLAGKRISLKDAELQFEVLDSQTNERLGVLVDKSPKEAKEKKLSWDGIKATFDVYAQRFKERLRGPGQKVEQ